MNKLLPIIESRPDQPDQTLTAATASRPRRGLPRQTELGPHAEDFIADDDLTGLLFNAFGSPSSA